MARRIILVVDADPAVARKAERALRGTACEVRGARTAAEAVQAARGLELAVLVSGTTLPDGTGYDLARSLRGDHPRASVVLLNGGFEVLDPERARDVGMDLSLRRPFSDDAFLGAMEQVLGPLPRVTEPAELTELVPEDMVSAAFDFPSPILAAPRPPLTAAERVATFIPADYEALPQVRVDPEVVSVAMERAILAVLPEALEIVLEKALRDSPVVRALVQDAVIRTVKEQLPVIARNLWVERVSGESVPRTNKA